MQPDSTHQLSISVAAGKGGTGKTLVATSMALALDAEQPGTVQLLDCDVEEPNAHLLLQPAITAQEKVEVLVPEVDLDLCTRCGDCARACQFSAIAVIRRAVLTFHDLCAGCGACAWVCPTNAITEVKRHVGTVRDGTAAEGRISFADGYLNIGDQRAGPVTTVVKDRIDPQKISILDAPPGTACPMQDTVEGTDYCILVTEPTPFGLSNLKDAVLTCRRIGVPCGVVINRDGVGDDGVDKYCESDGIEILLRIPQDRRIAEAYSRGDTLTDAFAQWRQPLVDVVRHIEQLVAVTPA